MAATKTRGKRLFQRIGLRELGFLDMAWLGLTPAQRLRRSWRLHRLLKNPQAVHDAKLWPKI